MPPLARTQAMDSLDLTPTMSGRSINYGSRPFDPVRDADSNENIPVFGAVALFCGYEYEDVHSWDEHSAGVPHFLPSTAPCIPTPARQPKSSGCGSLVHSGATVAHGWRGLAEGTTPNVIPLDSGYFPPGAAKMLKLGSYGQCGCRMEGVGCMICGNALGSKFHTCPAHSRPTRTFHLYTFLPSAVSPPLPFKVRPGAASEYAAPLRAPTFRTEAPPEPNRAAAILRAMHAIEDAHESLADFTPQSLSDTVTRPASTSTSTLSAPPRGLPPAGANRATAFLRAVHAQEPLSDLHLYELERALDTERLDLALDADTWRTPGGQFRAVAPPRRGDVGAGGDVLAAQIARAVVPVPGSDAVPETYARGPVGETFVEAVQRVRRRVFERTMDNSAPQMQTINAGPWFGTPVLDDPGYPRGAIRRAER
ncbi:hypothetical protein C8R44DRAFT_743062 [Mycena epipterygia]|nr:hypothetical protein C8R44DRAFT_743062 [Mycena epipterygia]